MVLLRDRADGLTTCCCRKCDVWLGCVSLTACSVTGWCLWLGLLRFLAGNLDEHRCGVNLHSSPLRSNERENACQNLGVCPRDAGVLVPLVIPAYRVRWRDQPRRLSSIHDLRRVPQTEVIFPTFFKIARYIDGCQWKRCVSPAVYEGPSNFDARNIQCIRRGPERFAAAGLVKRFLEPCTEKVWETGKCFPVTVSHPETILCFHIYIYILKHTPWLII